MRLEKIRLSGFKSFVDPTTIPVPGNLVGIVGPNGCGKSNIIDAVRWVMGESSAKHLRGGTMADVIFNGSASRKPVGLASVELVFDNSEGRAGGEYAKFNSISIKRQVSRDGQSVYLLNGSRCRRKDITDIFLGTGLGSRSYAIIEQGTISRLIEAKPEELRVFIEEAAGISKYKERRQETETRIRHTRENLERLQDLRDEVAKQIRNLARQARKAERYTALKAEQRDLQQQLLVLRWQSFDRACAEIEQRAQGAAAALEQHHRQHCDISRELEEARQAYKARQQQFNQIQGEFYQSGADVSRLEATINHARQTKETQVRELDHLRLSIDQFVTDLEQEQARATAAATELEAIEQHLQESEAAEEETGFRQAETQEQQRDWQTQWDSLRADLARHQEQIGIQHARIDQLQRQDQHNDLRIQRLQSERAELTGSDDEAEILALEQQLAELEARRAEENENFERANHVLQEQRQNLRQDSEALHRSRSELEKSRGRIDSLSLLQQHAMGKDRNALMQWLEPLALAEAPRLAQKLRVDERWEAAVETVLGIYLEAVCVDDARTYFPHFQQLPNESLAMIEQAGRLATEPSGDRTRLLDQVQSDLDLSPLLGGIFCARNLDEARALCADLTPQQSVITPEGLWLGPGWILNQVRENKTSGVLKREKELAALKQQETETVLTIEQLEARVDETEDQIKDSEQQRDQSQQREREIHAQIGQYQAQLSGHRARAEQTAKRLQQLEREIADLQGIMEQNAQLLAEAEDLQHQAGSELTRLQQQEEQLSRQQGQLRTALDESEQAARQAREQVHALKLRQESLRSTQNLAQNHRQRLESQYQAALERLAELEAAMNDNSLPIDQEQEKLKHLLGQRTRIEERLAQAREALESGETEINRRSEALLAAETEMAREREKLDAVRVEHEGMNVRRQTVQEQLDALGVDNAAVAEVLPEEADGDLWQSRIDALEREIVQLGAINLTAIEEHQAQTERMRYLDGQQEDLTESLTTLEQAIAKIDKECRSRFKDTFERVNNGLQRNFPKLFGGGQAYLALNEQNLLDAGVSVIARPPGKRNSSIHLLSGGEKALTAVALVFSIFELNPAPFCLLDEVDAPLDDANVGRFSRLVEEMSQAVQFLFITHNKVTMEIARHLAGVTMKEPGVSRMVAVDIDEAVELAAS